MYTVENVITGKHEDFHVKLLHAFDYDVMRSNIVDIATSENQLFIVESVVGHRWNNPTAKHTANNLLLLMMNHPLNR